MVYILAAILVFGVLIAVHELGHFMAAKACGVRVNEFSIGMGPALWKKQKGETQYSLRLFPVGGFCAMEGEEEDSDDPTALNNQGFWAKLLIFAAGAAMNFIAGLLIILILYADAQAFYMPVVAGFADGCPLESADGLQEGDRLLIVTTEQNAETLTALFGNCVSEVGIETLPSRHSREMTKGMWLIRATSRTVMPNMPGLCTWKAAM